MTCCRALRIALAAAVVLIVPAVAVMVGDGGSRDGEAPIAPRPSEPADPRAAARAAIERAAVAHRRALAPGSPEGPCAYMTPEAAYDAMVFADPRIRARGCTPAMRAAERNQSRPLYEARPPGVTGIQFLPGYPSRGSSAAPPARRRAGAPTAPGRRASFSETADG